MLPTKRERGRQQRRERRLQGDAKRLIVDDLALHGRIDEAQIAFRIGRLVEGELDVLHRHRIAVGEHGVADLESIDHAVIRDVPGFGNRGPQPIARLVGLDQRIADLLDGPDRAVVGNGEAGEAQRLFRPCHLEHAPALGIVAGIGRLGVKSPRAHDHGACSCKRPEVPALRPRKITCKPHPGLSLFAFLASSLMRGSGRRPPC